MESPLELPEPKLPPSNCETNEHSPFSQLIKSLKQEISTLRSQLAEAQSKLTLTLSQDDIRDPIPDPEVRLGCKTTTESPESHIEADYEHKLHPGDKVDVKYGNVVPIHRSSARNGLGFLTNAPVSKMAERIKLKRATDREVSASELVNSDIPTAMAEHIVGDILRQCDMQTEKQAIDMEFKRLATKLEHMRAQNSVLALTLSETKEHCDRYSFSSLLSNKIQCI